MKTTRLTALGIAAALSLGSAMAQAEETDTSIDQRNQVWSMQGAQDGSYAGAPLQTREQKRIQARTQTRTRAHAYGEGQGSRYGQGYESRGSYGSGAGSPGAGAGGAGRSGGQGGGRR